MKELRGVDYNHNNMKARKKPVIIDYYSLDNEQTIHQELFNWMESLGDTPNDHLRTDRLGTLVVTLEGYSYVVSTNDVIIRGVNGEYYPCKKDIFEKTYETIED